MQNSKSVIFNKERLLHLALLNFKRGDRKDYKRVTADEMVSAIPLCLLAIGLTVVSSQSLPNDADFIEVPSSDRRTFSHKKPIKVLPVFKKHKKFGAIVPHHIFGKAPSAEIVYQEAPKPIYKYHRYQGIEVKPVSDVSYSTPEPIIETHSIEPPVEDFGSAYASDGSFLPSSGSSFLLHPEHDKPIFSVPPAHVSLPSPPKPVFSYVPAAPQPVFPSIPIASVPAPAFPSISIPRPAVNPIQSLPPVLAPIPAPIPSIPRPSLPVSFPSLPQAPIPVSVPSLPHPTVPAPIPSLPHPPVSVSFPSNPLPTIQVSFPPNQLPPQPIFQSVPVKVQVPVLPPVPAPSPTPSFSSVKIPAPVQTLLPAPSPAPVLPSISTVAPTPVPAFPPLPVSLPQVQFSVLPSTLPPLPSFHPPSISATPEPEFPYPPSGVPVQSYIKDISLGDVEIKDTPLPTVEAPKYEEVTPAIADVGTKDLDLSGIKTGSGFFHKLKGWKTDVANSALGFAHFKPNPTFDPLPSKPTVDLPHVPSFPSLQLPGPIHSLPLAPAAVFLPPHFSAPTKYESFPPNNIEPPPLLNSYGLPIPQNAHASAHSSHDRLSLAASEEQPSVVQAPAEKQEQNLQIQQQTSQSPFQPQAIPHDHPIYVPEDNKTVKEEKRIEDVQAEEANEANSQDDAPNAVKYPNHKE